jgi:N6-L-threonylcarbamoyladenine synthase
VRILSIETSCDETAVALLDINGPLEAPDIKILGNSLLSQAQLHEEYGGVYPNLAKREHTKNLPILLNKVLEETRDKKQDTNGFEIPDIDFIAVTAGPGLEPALWTGITFAEELGKKWGKPVIPVNHMEGHVYSVLHRTESRNKTQETRNKLEMPALALLVSGGHTELVYIKDFGKHEILGRTKDDAVGEAFDKVARMLGLPYPGGPRISTLAEIARNRAEQTQNSAKISASGPHSSALYFPRPMAHSGDLNFSFSGLKTSVLYKTKSLEMDRMEVKEDVARAFEDAAVEVLVSKTKQALKIYEGDIKTLIVAGGVAANDYLQQKLRELITEFPSLELKFPSPDLTSDNAIMIGIGAYVSIKTHPEILENRTPLVAKGNLLLGS